MVYCDAHCHLQMAELSGVNLSHYWQVISHVVVNGTHPSDWESVAQIAAEQPTKVIPHFGVHPWRVNELEEGWLDVLRAFLIQYPFSGVGEIGLDKWVRGYNLPKQKQVFLSQLELANELKRPVSIHCLRAWGALKALIDDRLDSPFLLHAYSGPSELVSQFVKQGAYFSFSPYFCHARKSDVKVMFKTIPLERILIETDAPSMLGPRETWSTEQLKFSEAHQHPSNIVEVYREFSEYLGMPLMEFSQIVKDNFSRLFSR